MADQDEYHYLQPGFDLTSLTIPRIRSILVAHDVNYPSSAKKQDLVEIVQQEVLPKAKKLLNAQARVRRTSRGITDVPSSQDGTLDGDDDDRGQMQPPPPKTPRGRKSKTNLDADDSSVAPTPRTSRKSKTPSGRTSTKTRISDGEGNSVQTSASARKTRKSISDKVYAGRLAVEINEPDSLYSRRSLPASETPFSDDNPFQSGSSPPSAPRIPSTSRPTKLTGDAKRKSTSGRRNTISPQIKQEEFGQTRSTYELPIEKLGIDKNGIAVTEEFTADAKQELEDALAVDKQLARSRNSALVRRKKPVSAATKSAPFIVLVSVLTALGAWYRQEKVNIGYCGVGASSWSLAANPNIPVWVHENVQPQCEPCPPHAICSVNMEVECERDFVLQPHPLSFNGLIPLVPTCEPDSEKERRIKAVADRAVEELRSHRAAYECGTTIVNTGSDHSAVASQTFEKAPTMEAKLEVSEETLKAEVSKMRRKGMSSQDFEDLWQGALEDIINRDEVEVVRDGSGILLSSRSLANLPFTCAIRRSFVRTLSRYRISLTFLIITLLSTGYGRYRLVTYKQAKAQTPSLVAMTLDRLATQAALKEDGRTSEGFISITQLRDDVLRNVFSATERERVWQRVRKVVEGNSNVRAATREGGKTGEWSRVWEWIGPVDLVPGLEGRRSGGMIRGAESIEQDSGTDKQVVEVRRWDEGRAIY